MLKKHLEDKMTQQEVIDYLKKIKEWKTAREIAKALRKGSVNDNVKKLRKSNDIYWKIDFKTFGHPYKYKYKQDDI